MRKVTYNKRNYRKLAIVILSAAVMIWLAGCTTGQTISLSALVWTSDKGEVQDQGGLAAGNGGDGILISVTEPDRVKGDRFTGVNGNGNSVYIPRDEDSSYIEDNNSVNSSGQDQDDGGEVAPDQEKQKPGEKNVVALTFDDGPDNRYTTAILDILKEEGVKATFFVVGSQVEKHPEVLQRMHDEGHGIGNHSLGHENFRKLSRKQIIHNVARSDKAIEEVLGYSTKWFRAPYGALSKTLLEVLEEQDREHTGWTVDTRDWAGTSVKDMQEMIRHETKPGGILLMHSFGGKHIKNTVEMLPGAIKDLREMGYTFVTMDELEELGMLE
ncbi:polysaccharide deacetylase family protein [Paenibacillus chungangensis]|uniref:Polysaccharide deacetylase family protein n=1 Tax=Paenibacillus chungangensis TaxID=696535 RepID=A0ABW3HRJ7_9BACL